MEYILSYTLFTDVYQMLIIGFIIMFSQIIYASLGFGSGMFAISILAYLYGRLDFIVPMFTIVCLPTELYITIKDRKEINLRTSGIFLIIIIPALLYGSVLLRNSQNKIFLLLLGLIILLLSAYYLFFEDKLKFALKQFYWIPFFGIISGILGGLFGMAGPPLILYFKHIKLSKSEFRVALLSIFSVMTFFRIIFYSFLGIISCDLIMTSLSVTIFALIGLCIGNLLHSHISEFFFKKITAITLIVSAVLIIIKNI
ncbi:MAG: sulfite exporter TauE/SafE family protein [Candidatus Cloacimonetes bacterium]|nr:sulfite exporter TauE/SafE family protein [Candidatus Cloacimonadota bacterium]